MKNPIIALLLMLSGVTLVQAQSKVFKAINEDISSQMKTIFQDGAVVGYLVFTQLEKASADSFNYKISIMDENLNDIGTVNFREQMLYLYGVAFEQDVLCLAYLKTNVYGYTYKNKKEFNAALPKAKNFVMTQFLNLNGKIVGTNLNKVDISQDPYWDPRMGGPARTSLKHGVQLQNISQQGFACFYGDDTKRNFFVYNTAGKQMVQKTVADDAKSFGLFVSSQFAYILMKKAESKNKDGDYELVGFNTRDGSVLPKYILKDKKGNPLKPLRMDNDPVTGKAYITGYILDQDRVSKERTIEHYLKGGYAGLFTLNLNGPAKGDVQAVYSYWKEGGLAGFSKKGLDEQHKDYPWFTQTFRDYQGNTYFAGSFVKSKFRTGSCVASMLVSPFLLFVPAFTFAARGPHKCNLREAVIYRQDAKGALTLDQSIPANSSSAMYSGEYVAALGSRNLYNVNNGDTRTTYLVVDDGKNIQIYNALQKKITRTIPHKDSNTLTSVFPAKEGHVMVSEYDKKGKTARLSIEAI